MDRKNNWQIKEPGFLLHEHDVLRNLLELCEWFSAGTYEIELMKNCSQRKDKLK